MTSIENIDNIVITDLDYYIRYKIEFIDTSEVFILKPTEDDDEEIEYSGNASYNHKWFGIAKVFCQRFDPIRALILVESLEGFYGSTNLNHYQEKIQVKQ